MDKDKLVLAANRFLEQEKQKFSREKCEEIAKWLHYLGLILEPDELQGKTLPVQKHVAIYQEETSQQGKEGIYWEDAEADIDKNINEEDESLIEEILPVECFVCDKELCIVGITESGLEMEELYLKSFGYFCFDCFNKMEKAGDFDEFAHFDKDENDDMLH